MNSNIMSLVRKMAAEMGTPKLNAAQKGSIEEGKQFAEQFIEAARAAEVNGDHLMMCVALAGRAGVNGDCVLRGFFQGITKALEVKQ